MSHANYTLSPALTPNKEKMQAMGDRLNLIEREMSSLHDSILSLNKQQKTKLTELDERLGATNHLISQQVRCCF
jgi:predicted nuclease with TOPRIM domain